MTSEKEEEEEEEEKEEEEEEEEEEDLIRGLISYGQSVTFVQTAESFIHRCHRSLSLSFSLSLSLLNINNTDLIPLPGK